MNNSSICHSTSHKTKHTLFFSSNIVSREVFYLSLQEGKCNALFRWKVNRIERSSIKLIEFGLINQPINRHYNFKNRCTRSEISSWHEAKGGGGGEIQFRYFQPTQSALQEGKRILFTALLELNETTTTKIFISSPTKQQPQRFSFHRKAMCGIPKHCFFFQKIVTALYLQYIFIRRQMQMRRPYTNADYRMRVRSCKKLQDNKAITRR